MTIFAVIAPGDSPALKAAIAEHYPESYYEVAPGQFFISTKKTTTSQVSEKLGLPKNEVGRAMVLHVTNWNGWHSKNVWEWLTAQNNADIPDVGGVNG
jgi:hypothetical protein